MSTKESVNRFQRIGGTLMIFSGTRFWAGTIIYLCALVPLTLWVDVSGVFLGWMRPIVYAALSVALIVAMKTFLHFRRLGRKGED